MPHSVYVTTGVWWSIKECKNFSMEISLNAACLLLSIMIISSEYAMSSVTMTQSNSEVIIEGTTHMTCATSLPNEVHWRHLPAGGPAHEPKEVYAFGKMRSPYKDRFEIQINRTMGLYRLVISRVELTDAGIYTCQEDEGIGNFSQAQLTVLEAGPVCSSTQNPIELIGPNSCNKKQEDLVLACSVAYRGNSPPLLEWKMVGAIDTVTQGLTVEEMGNRITCHLTMSSQLSIDGSSFVCQTRKTQYNCTSGVINITYAVSSDFTRKALIGDTVVCSANTSESCSYRWKWFKGDDVLTASNSRTLIPEKSGNFRCEADCIIRNESCTITAGFAYVEDGNATSTTGDKVCPDELDKEYSIHWRRTKAGTESYAPCPRNNSGTCSRNCSLGIDGNPLWSAPNCNGCFDKEFKDLLEKVNKVNLTAFKNQTVIAKIASQLSTVTNKSEGLSPGNLNASVMMIKQLADLRTERTINANAMEIKSIVQAANNVLQPNNSKSWQELEEVNKNIATSILFSLDVYGRSLAALNTSDHSIEVEDSLVLEAWSFEKSNLREIEFPNGSLWDENRGDGISISVEAFKNSMSSESPSALHMWGSYYRTVNDYLPGNEGGTDDVNSRVLSFSIDGLKTNERLNRPVLITLRHNQEKRTSFQRTCAFWNFSGGNWDSVGCSVTSTNLTHTICSCDHLTNFAILMSLKPKEDWLLSLISIIGCSISVAALILTIFVYALTWKQAKSAQATVLLNLCVALIIAYIIFMVGADKVHSKGFSKIGCQTVAVLLHYFFLAAFFIMLAEGVELLLYIIFVFHVRRTRETVMLVISAWVLPLIIVGVSLGSTKLEGYGHEKACWLSSENHLIWAFVGPVLGIIAANFVILIIVLRWRSQKKALLSKNVKKRDEINATIWNLAVTCPVLGLGWLFGFLTLAFDHTVFQYMFVAVNSVQGLLIFIFHALFHNKRVNERISSLFSTYICSRCRNSDQAVITQSTSSSQDQPTKKADKKGGAPRGGMGKQGNVRGHGTQLTSFGDSETMESTQ